MVGSSSSEQQVDAEDVDEIVGHQNNLSLIDLCNYHVPTIGLVLIVFIFIIILVICTHQRYKLLKAEVTEHRMRSGLFTSSLVLGNPMQCKDYL